MTPEQQQASDRKKAKDTMDRMIAVERTAVICECHYKPAMTEHDKLYEKMRLQVAPETKSHFTNGVNLHYVKVGHSSIKCVQCGNHWCCDECAIMEDAIPGILSQWTEFARKTDKNISLVTCLICDPNQKIDEE